MVQSKTRPLHVVMILDEWFPSKVRKVGSYGGVQVHVRELKKYLELKHNCQVVLFYQSHSHPILKFFWPLIAFVDILLYNRYHSIQLIHSHGVLSGFSAKLLSLALKIPAIQTVHGTHWLDQKRHNWNSLLQKISHLKVPYSIEITVSKNFLKYPNRNSDIRVIPNGVNLTEFNRVKVNRSPNPSLIWVGKDDPSKGLEVLKKAILKVRKIVPRFQSQLVSDGRLTGRELIRAYKKAHVFVLPSLAEGQPITLLEAWAAKLPVVVTDVGDNGSMVKNGHNGCLVEPNNAQQLAMAILKIIRSKTKGTKMGEAGYQYVKTHYSWQKMAKSTYTVYRDALALSVQSKTAVRSGAYKTAAV